MRQTVHAASHLKRTTVNARVRVLVLKGASFESSPEKVTRLEVAKGDPTIPNVYVDVTPVGENVSHEGRAGLRVYENEDAFDEHGPSTRIDEGIEVSRYEEIFSGKVVQEFTDVRVGVKTVDVREIVDMGYVDPSNTREDATTSEAKFSVLVCV